MNFDVMAPPTNGPREGLGASSSADGQRPMENDKYTPKGVRHSSTRVLCLFHGPEAVVGQSSHASQVVVVTIKARVVDIGQCSCS